MPEDTAAFSQPSPVKPSLLLALVAALIVAAYNRRWLAQPVQALATAASGPPPCRMSRLRARLQSVFEAHIQRATRHGRPPKAPSQELDESLVLRELLALVPRDTWRYLPGNRRLQLVQAQNRLQQQHGLSAKRFCKLLGISTRTFRSWKQRSKSSPKKTEPTAPPDEASCQGNSPPAKPPRRATGRFDLEVTAPGVQVVADTTDWEFLGVPMKIVATQDPGARKEKLWESFVVDTEENSRIVVDAFQEAARDRPGLQAVVDQGTPYMAEATQAALESLEYDHAPQKEGTPTEKATKERAFRTVKDALRPLVELSRKLAERVGALREPSLAKALGKILLSVYLRVYEAAPRIGAHPLEGRSRDELEAIVEEQREKARAEGRSKRLLLSAIHAQYNFPGSPQRFIRAFRNHALEDIQEAERRMRFRACRCEVRACDRYFAGILRNVAEEARKRRADKRRTRLRASAQKRYRAEGEELLSHRSALAENNPEALIQEGLDSIATQWLTEPQRLFLEGRGLGLRLVQQALTTMDKHNAYSVADRAEVAFQTWKVARPADSTPLRKAVHQVLTEALADFRAPSPSTAQLLGERILPSARFHNPTRHAPQIHRPGDPTPLSDILHRVLEDAMPNGGEKCSFTAESSGDTICSSARFDNQHRPPKGPPRLRNNAAGTWG
jgi:hypothetical protein